MGRPHAALQAQCRVPGLTGREREVAATRVNRERAAVEREVHAAREAVAGRVHVAGGLRRVHGASPLRSILGFVWNVGISAMSTT